MTTHQSISLQDIAACFVCIILAVGTVVLAFEARQIPPEMSNALASALVWLFVRSTQAAANRQNPNGANV